MSARNKHRIGGPLKQFRLSDDGGSAFPESVAFDPAGDVFGSRNGGLSIRDWFAGKALLGLLMNQQDDAISSGEHAECSSIYAEDAYRLADAMLAARHK